MLNNSLKNLTSEDLIREVQKREKEEAQTKESLDMIQKSIEKRQKKYDEIFEGINRLSQEKAREKFEKEREYEEKKAVVEAREKVRKEHEKNHPESWNMGDQASAWRSVRADLFGGEKPSSTEEKLPDDPTTEALRQMVRNLDSKINKPKNPDGWGISV